jgi:hypothetical protein
LKTIKELEGLLKSPKRMREIVGDRTASSAPTIQRQPPYAHISRKEGESGGCLLTSSELTPAKEVWAVILPDGTAARTSDDKLPRVSGVRRQVGC